MAERVFTPGVLPPAAGRAATAPFQFVTTGEDSLRVTVINSAPSVRVAVQGRRIDQAGTILPIAWSVAPSSNRTPTTRVFPLGVGAMVNLAVWASEGSPVVGQTFVIVQIVRGHTGATELLGTLLGGYVTGTQGLGWPGSPIVSSTDGEPYVRHILGTTPAAGAGIIETVPTGARWQLLGLRFQLSTSAVAVTRYVAVGAGSGSVAPYYIPSPRQQIASELRVFSFGVGLEYAVNDVVGTASHALPDHLLLSAGDSFSVGVVNMQAGDQLGAPQFVVREWLEVP